MGSRELDLVVDVLAVQRATRLITTDTITAPLRNRVFKAFPLGKYPHGPGFVATCDFCASVYAAAAITATHAPVLRFLRPIVYLLAIAAPVAIIADYKEQQARPTGWS